MSLFVNFGILTSKGPHSFDSEFDVIPYEYLTSVLTLTRIFVFFPEINFHRLSNSSGNVNFNLLGADVIFKSSSLISAIDTIFFGIIQYFTSR